MRKSLHILSLLLLPYLLAAQSSKKSDCNYIKGFLSITTILKPTCYGGSDASILANAIGSGGSGGVSINYYIDGMPNTIPSPIFNNLTSGWHVIISESSQDKCRDTLKVFIPEPDSIDLKVKIDTVSCLLGSFTAVASGGNPGPLDIFWNTQPLATHSPTLGNIAQGETWTVTAKDVRQCTKSLTVTMPAPNPLKVNVVVQDAKCKGEAAGNIFLYPDGTPPYSYKWADSNGNLPSTDDKLLKIAAGNYFVTITDASSCTYTNQLTVKDGVEIKLDKKVSTASCTTSNDGAIEIIASGGSTPYTYLWSNNATTAKIEKLSGGNYKIVVLDGNGCRAEETISVAFLYPYSTVKSITNTTCHDTKDGVAEITPIGGTSPFTYIWSDSKNQTNSKAIDLEPGTYFVTATDAYKCIHIDTLTISKPTPLALSMQATAAKCHDSKDGGVVAQVSGGNGNYLVKWCDGFFGLNRDNLPGGLCDVTVTDDKGCVLNDVIDIPKPTKLTIDDIIITDVNCFGETNGALEGQVSGGTSPYNYQWNDANMQLLPKATNLNKGNYTLRISDANGCTTTKSADVNEPTQLTALAQVSSPKCFGDANGSFELIADGGNGQYKYTWSIGTVVNSTSKQTNVASGNYSFTITDAKNCSITDTFVLNDPQPISFDIVQTFRSCAGQNQNTAEVKNIQGGSPTFKYEWSNGQNQDKAINLPEGIIAVTITDNNLCNATKDITIQELDSIQATLQFLSPSCYGFRDGEAGVITVKGGIGNDIPSNYSYVWNTTPIQTTQFVYDIIGNRKYEVIITDAQGCIGSSSIFVFQPNPIVLSTKKVDAKCYDSQDGEIEVVATSDNPNFLYEWNDSNKQTDAKAIGLKAGDYTVTVTDGKNCTATTSVKINQPPAIQITNAKLTNNKCFGDIVGSIALSAEGGIGTLKYAWINKENTPNISQLKAGTYSVTISDSNQCNVIKDYTITEPAELQIGLDPTDVTCFGLKNGAIEISAKGGTKPYSYSSNGSDFNGLGKLVGLTAGNYDVYVKDINGCINVSTVAVEQPDKFEVEILDDVTVAFGEVAELKAEYKNNVGKVQLKWSSPAEEVLNCKICEDVTVKTKTTTTINLEVTDQNGCKAEDFAVVAVIKEGEIFVPTGFSPNNDGKNEKLMVHGKSNIKILSFRVYDRWGEMIFEVKDFKPNDDAYGWDGTFRGTNMPSGAYAWVIEVEYPSGDTEKTRGGTTLLR
jgi:gliding motility-associated-like protein